MPVRVTRWGVSPVWGRSTHRSGFLIIFAFLLCFISYLQVSSPDIFWLRYRYAWKSRVVTWKFSHWKLETLESLCRNLRASEARKIACSFTTPLIHTNHHRRYAKKEALLPTQLNTKLTVKDHGVWKHSKGFRSSTSNWSAYGGLSDSPDSCWQPIPWPSLLHNSGGQSIPDHRHRGKGRRSSAYHKYVQRQRAFSSKWVTAWERATRHGQQLSLRTEED